MQVYTYSEARQKLASVLDKAESTGSVIIQRRDGRSFTLVPQKSPVSPLDVPSVGARISTEELVDLVREERGRTRGWKARR
ncbi:MAG: type II toxin-antitoxin system Phd/YefM family antitoxin [Lentisphaerae bacterium]|nr:type II toxin-antitoxin system Phd/YefM family antitoxin [Lentisphaerota bacterium]